jgi:SM-20-related protein
MIGGLFNKILISGPNLMSPDASHFKLYLIKDFFDAHKCGEIIAELRDAEVNAATVYGRGDSASVDERTRKAARLLPAPATLEGVSRRLLDRRQDIGSHFGLELNSCEEPQFLRYRVGDFFVAHQDGNTGMMQSEREQRRKISVVIFLNQQSEAPQAGCYNGGDLVFSEWRRGRNRGQFHLAGKTGMLVAFPSETTHEVIPVTHGERYSIASWYGV